mmetsp:Transcript_18598/g.43531  ORF Transcript_18598/g.43531 Transcript_18598/m.43531 type:complete len:100 (-) Transcript_18598:1266-1565(-)
MSPDFRHQQVIHLVEAFFKIQLDYPRLATLGPSKKVPLELQDSVLSPTPREAAMLLVSHQRLSSSSVLLHTNSGIAPPKSMEDCDRTEIFHLSCRALLG